MYDNYFESYGLSKCDDATRGKRRMCASPRIEENRHTGQLDA